ncbi:hypothetical protein KIN20_027557 [Parelaphostrongylus tenuis]|uniref:Uncharacterized protein n=1 Tax=Parelaphostrongylus tenuis TaxID=148309 RepID=A0AAD5R026_PARTN|nr:hypothetical protein KIN20_027557 [Parelaphostrongylus tenuis]
MLMDGGEEEEGVGQLGMWLVPVDELGGQLGHNKEIHLRTKRKRPNEKKKERITRQEKFTPFYWNVK